jgi:tetratricopeptide (TPR) repeat protein
VNSVVGDGLSTGVAKREPVADAAQSEIDPAHRDQALAYTRDRQWPAAFDAWRQILTRDQNNWEALYRLCEASFCLGNISDTVFHGERARQLRPDDLRPLLFLGRCYSRMRNFETAQAIWNRLTEHNPAFYEAWFRLAQSQIENGERAAAIESVDRALALDPLNPAAYPVIGGIMRALPPEEAEGAIARWLGMVEAEKIGAGMILLDHIPRPKTPPRKPAEDLRAAFKPLPKAKASPKVEAPATWEGRLANARAACPRGLGSGAACLVGTDQDEIGQLRSSVSPGTSAGAAG